MQTIYISCPSSLSLTLSLFSPELSYVSSSQSVGSKKHCRLQYYVIFWTAFWLVSIWAMLDRFLWNLYPMTINFPPLLTSLPSKGVPPETISGAILFFDGFGRATGRLIVTVFAALFWTQVKTTENFLMEHCPKWIELGDLRTIHNRIHYVLGVFFMAIPLVIHCLLIFLPGIMGVPLRLGGPGSPGAKVSPFVWANTANAIPTAEMFITHDNVYRAILIVLLFCILFPFSMSNWGRKRYFSATQFLHLLCVAAFSIDMLRKAPHTQVFSSPVIAYYIIDRIVGYWFYRTGEAQVIHKELLDEDYMVLFLYVSRQKRRRYVGSTYYLQMKGFEGMLDIAHPYVSFQNHSKEPLLPEWTDRDSASAAHKFYIDRSTQKRSFQKRQSRIVSQADAEDLADDSTIAAETEDVVFFSNWNTAIVMQIHRWNSDRSFTARVSEMEQGEKIKFWGPYLTEYAEMTPDGLRHLPPIVAIGSGAGVGPLLDFYLKITANNIALENPVVFYFTTASVGLFQFFSDLTCVSISFI